jgi:hypothetical protein
MTIIGSVGFIFLKSKTDVFDEFIKFKATIELET